MQTRATGRPVMAGLARQAIPGEEQDPGTGPEAGLVGNGHRPVAIHPAHDVACQRQVGPGALQPPSNAPWIRGLPLQEAERHERGDTLYLRRARGGRFRGLTEVELPSGFSVEGLRSYLGKIADPSLRTLVATEIERFLPDAE